MNSLSLGGFVETLALLNAFLRVASTHLVPVNSFSGNDSACAANWGVANETPCRTIKQAYHLVENSSNSTLYLTSNLTLWQVLRFHGLRNITLRAPSEVTVSCEGESGISATEVHSFTMINLRLVNCGHRSSFSSAGSIVFNSSSQLTLLRVKLINGRYSGMVLINCVGNIYITEVAFIGNKYNNRCNATGRRRREDHPRILSAQSADLRPSRDQRRRGDCSGKADAGGGLKVELSGRTSGSIIKIASCYFLENWANWGGGLSAAFRDAVTNHSLLIVLTVFRGNNACTGGGGLRVFFVTNPGFVFKNKILINDTLFVKNHAKYGAGVSFVSVYSSFSEKTRSRNIVFRNCTWSYNTASLMSPAVDIVPHARLNSEKYGFLPSPWFIDVTVANNSLVSPAKLMFPMNENDGVFILSRMQVFFSSYVCFHNNSPTAILATSGGIIIEEYTTFIFSLNRGTNGAAVALYGYSYIYTCNNVLVSFKGNKAKKNGAAIYYQGIDQHDFFVGSYCFLENSDGRPRNVTFWFEGNIAENGSWIYTQSFLSCAIRCHAKISYPLKFQSIMKCIGDFKFGNDSVDDVEELVSTSAQRVRFVPRTRLLYKIVPGGTLEIPYTITDEFNSSITPLTYISVAESHSPVSFDRKYTLHNQFQPVGAPDRNATVDVTVLGMRQIHFQFLLHTDNCSPGFVYDSRTKSCACGNGESSGFYKPVTSCTKVRPQAVLDKPYWVGYIPGNSRDYRDLYFVPCFSPVCRLRREYLDASAENLSRSICGEGRTGVMCGECEKNFSVFFHSRSFSCKRGAGCKYGYLLFAASELLPVLVVFLVVLIFDFSLTSGSVTGFIFFCQYLGIVSIDAEESKLDFIKIPYQLFYGIFDLDYFSIESLSFCLWKDSHIQDIVFFKYSTIAFAFSLVVLQMATLKIYRSVTVCKLRKCFGRRRRSFIRSLCAFLVISYIQCTKTSFFILKYVRPEGLNGSHENYYTYYGGERFFHGIHKTYATFALFTVVLVTVTPSVILLLHPLLLQVLVLLQHSEHQLVRKLLKCLHTGKLLPFLDCFQSCYQERYRVFAGLYLAYRVALLLCFALSKSYTILLYWVQLLLLVFLGVHAAIQPYKKKVHNLLDSLIFSNLSLINLLSIMMQTDQHDSPETSGHTLTLQLAQVILIYLPMVVCLLFATWRVYSYVKVRCSSLQHGLVEGEDTAGSEVQEQKLNDSTDMLS